MKKIIFILILLISSNLFAQKQIPNLNIANIDGKTMSLKSDFAEKDKLYIFSFWATWCTPCIAELEEMNDVQDEWKKELNLEIIGVATDDTRTQKRVKPLVNGKGWNYNILMDTNQEFKRAMSIVNIPYTIVVKNGVIVHIQNGFVPGSEEELLAKLKTL
jgi:peroxiredoxin